MIEKIILVGIGETADIAYEYFSCDNRYQVVAFAVNQSYLSANEYKSLPLVPLENVISDYPPDSYKAFVAMSSGRLNRNREEVYLQVKALGYRCVSYISPYAFVWRTAKIGENCFIFEGNVIQHDVIIGNNVVLWSGNHVGHQTVIRDHAFISSHCVISGYCDIGENSFLGVNCTFAEHMKIGRDCFIGMGALISKELAENVFIKPFKSEIAKSSAKRFCKVEVRK